ncbi:hypothetical protein, unlikely [Trypanosoma brucei gambiense DAL972]|uniref:Uncharacterized protein n=1 Tax=Trypanosoma brucei gambiense (strain MHOM/CI/86/DAL972) TaxID=679716 RepID=C9ZRC3_TRYB9|nr:hypothetical protein, unlikely [Trypanosoma brucei gambiense DAL972]CBH11953.1 hypothetical protein, unlikely [Trypanosoma brucei gambiense DAL972]|eukprot:XP_011774238.1 hypothetical protein, unlikely [Trypanosoma brucei gambiense DAL972]
MRHSRQCVGEVKNRKGTSEGRTQVKPAKKKNDDCQWTPSNRLPTRAPVRDIREPGEVNETETTRVHGDMHNVKESRPNRSCLLFIFFFSYLLSPARLCSGV